MLRVKADAFRRQNVHGEVWREGENVPGRLPCCSGLAFGGHHFNTCTSCLAGSRRGRMAKCPAPAGATSALASLDVIGNRLVTGGSAGEAIRRAQELAGVDDRARPMKSSSVVVQPEGAAPSAEAAIADGRAAGAATTTSATSAAAATASTAAAATTASTATAAPSHLLSTGGAVFLVEQMEGGETDVGDFFFTEQDTLGRREIQFLRGVRRRQGRCRSAPCERKCQPGSAQSRDCGFGHTLPLRSLLQWHSRILLQPVRPVFDSSPHNPTRKVEIAQGRQSH